MLDINMAIGLKTLKVPGYFARPSRMGSGRLTQGGEKVVMQAGRARKQSSINCAGLGV
jgi:hypothetical protein